MTTKGVLTGIVVLLLAILTFDGIYLLIKYQQSLPDPAISFTPQQTQTFPIDPDKPNTINVLATTLPQFAMKLADQKFNHLWEVQAAERNDLIETEVQNPKEGEKIEVSTTYSDQDKNLVFTPKMKNSVKPGLYKLDVKVKTLQNEYITITQDFSWGVLAINTNKGIYKVGETTKIGMTVLDDQGKTKCMSDGTILKLNEARVWLTITTPSGNEKKFSTEDKTISSSPDCADRKYTNKADFLTELPSTEAGKYSLHMEAETSLGKKSIDDYYTVQNETQPFEIERTQYPTRIFPRYLYPVEITVRANQNYKGKVSDIVPAEFNITEISNYGGTKAKDNFQTVEWTVDWQAGQTYKLKYTIKFPPIVPEFYLVGPLNIGQYKEGRSWQIASDGIFQLLQEADNTAASGTSVTATFSSAATSGHLLVLICSRDTNNTWNTPTGWSRRYRVTSAPRIYHFDRITPGAGLTSATCTTSTNSGGIAAQLLEFSGNSTSGYFDKAGSVHNANTCNTGAHNETANSITPTNPDELLVAAAASINPNLTVSGHNTISGASSTGFTDTDINGGGDGFNDAAASYDSAWGEAVNNPPVSTNSVFTWSGAGGTCSSDIVAYNPTVTISQGSYRFFDNANNILPGNPLAAQNTTITLSQPNYQFRLRILLDIDSPTSSLGLDAGDFILQYAPMPLTNSCLDVTNWTQVLDEADGTDIAFNDNPAVADGTNITSSGNDPADTSPAYTTVLESYYDTKNDAGTPPDISNHQSALINNRAGLWDLSLVDNTDDSTSRTYCLRLSDSSGGDLDAYRNYPTVTTIPIDVNIRGGSQILGGTIIQ